MKLDLESEELEGCILIDGFDDCIIGVTYGGVNLDNAHICYSREAIINKLVKEFSEDSDESSDEIYTNANEYFEFNILGAYMGKQSPIFLSNSLTIINEPT